MFAIIFCAIQKNDKGELILKLLIAEDDFTSRAMLEAITGKWGYETIAVEDDKAT